MSLALDILTGLLPYLATMGAFLFGYSKKKEADRQRAKAKTMEVIASAEKANADNTSKMLDAVIESENISKQAVDKAVENAKTNHNHFSR